MVKNVTLKFERSNKPTVRFDYELGSHVKIIELNCNARIIAFYVDSGGIQYRCRFFFNGEVKTEYFFIGEFKKI